MMLYICEGVDSTCEVVEEEKKEKRKLSAMYVVATNAMHDTSGEQQCNTTLLHPQQRIDFAVIATEDPAYV